MILKTFNLDKVGYPKIDLEIQYTLELSKMEVQLGNAFLRLLHIFSSCGNVFALPSFISCFESFTSFDITCKSFFLNHFRKDILMFFKGIGHEHKLGLQHKLNISLGYIFKLKLICNSLVELKKFKF
jgi:hypothetical protein